MGAGGGGCAHPDWPIEAISLGASSNSSSASASAPVAHRAPPSRYPQGSMARKFTLWLYCAALRAALPRVQAFYTAHATRLHTRGGSCTRSLHSGPLTSQAQVVLGGRETRILEGFVRTARAQRPVARGEGGQVTPVAWGAVRWSFIGPTHGGVAGRTWRPGRRRPGSTRTKWRAVASPTRQARPLPGVQRPFGGRYRGVEVVNFELSVLPCVFSFFSSE